MTWNVSGTLPPGLALSADGKIAGTPTTPGTFTFLVTADDGAGGTGSKQYTITIAPSQVGHPLTISPNVLPNGVVGQPYGPVQLAAAAVVQSGPGPMFPLDHIFSTPIDSAPVLANSDAMIAKIQADAAAAGKTPTIHPGMEIPVNVGANFPLVQINFGPESDSGLYGIPPNPQVEGPGDSHMLAFDTATKKLYEIYQFVAGPPPSGSSGSMWDASGYALRPLGWTSADGAGLPMAPLILRFSEFATGVVNHALRVTCQVTRAFGTYAGAAVDPNGSVPTPFGVMPCATWPARHRANQTDFNPNTPSMGERLRLKASFDDSSLSPETRIITNCLKKYGFMVADNGSSLFFQGDTDPGWTPALIDKITTECRGIPLTAFEAVDGVTGFLVDVNSGKAKQPA